MTRYILTCRTCGTRATVEGDGYHGAHAEAAMLRFRERSARAWFAPGGHSLDNICCCDRRVRIVMVRGTYSARHVCNPKCESSHGPTCTCQCGGKNHGGAYAA